MSPVYFYSFSSQLGKHAEGGWPNCHVLIILFFGDFSVGNLFPLNFSCLRIGQPDSDGQDHGRRQEQRTQSDMGHRGNDHGRFGLRGFTSVQNTRIEGCDTHAHLEHQQNQNQQRRFADLVDVLEVR